jgi:hypothetical protein
VKNNTEYIKTMSCSLDKFVGNISNTYDACWDNSHDLNLHTAGGLRTPWDMSEYTLNSLWIGGLAMMIAGICVAVLHDVAADGLCSLLEGVWQAMESAFRILHNRYMPLQQDSMVPNQASAVVQLPEPAMTKPGAKVAAVPQGVVNAGQVGSTPAAVVSIDMVD